ncbi:uncharacterized protein LOC127095980 [Lathyrus oleraceus]|uniref:uncharacterized protein LOC127095980 n=1 Tax=Pisum sativum TaxID=3888 RepID=UPI0021D01953|nr:uncharacterized protein LOC127095980 [Pisum sativum]
MSLEAAIASIFANLNSVLVLNGENLQGLEKSDTISEGIANAKDFLFEIEKHFKKSDKTETSTLLQNLISMKNQSKGNIREYIMSMSNIVSKLKALKLELSKDLLFRLVLLSLPSQFGLFKISYNCQNEKWSLNELISFVCKKRKE